MLRVVRQVNTRYQDRHTGQFCFLLPLFVIAKTAKPRCFNNVKNLPLDYAANKKAWMTSDLFVSWLRKLDKKYLLSIAMIVDNCPAHPDIDNLKAVKFVFLPPNTTNILQPCDQGIINSFKRLYRQAVVQRYLVHIDTGSPTTLNISVLEAPVHHEKGLGCQRYSGGKLFSPCGILHRRENHRE
ncbi:hypothetical protein RRG08_032802 [Elysia crispata]|uniref:DDE-1 domain-containing protein n=1 Tax=Elysia crispata TaxID=231223 RepID=A0AAE1D1T2_9GAST|nr:hypothetical protein RRG08_032802 [Elysia crispata]